jgi:hypothetical protein
MWMRGGGGGHHQAGEGWICGRGSPSRCNFGGGSPPSRLKVKFGGGASVHMCVLCEQRIGFAVFLAGRAAPKRATTDLVDSHAPGMFLSRT